MTYVPPHSPMKRDEWPTLKEMLDSGKRLVVFMDKGADEKTVPFILPQFPNVCTLSLLNCCLIIFLFFRCGKTHTILQTINSLAKSIVQLVLFNLPNNSTWWTTTSTSTSCPSDVVSEYQIVWIVQEPTASIRTFELSLLFFPPAGNARIVIDGELFFFRIKLHASHCAPLENDQYPNFVLVDFVNIGQAVQAVAELNGFKH